MRLGRSFGGFGAAGALKLAEEVGGFSVLLAELHSLKVSEQNEINALKEKRKAFIQEEKDLQFLKDLKQKYQFSEVEIKQLHELAEKNGSPADIFRAVNKYANVKSRRTRS